VPEMAIGNHVARPDVSCFFSCLRQLDDNANLSIRRFAIREYFPKDLFRRLTANPDRRVRESAGASRLSTGPSGRHFGGRPGQLDFQVAHSSQSRAVPANAPFLPI
jgi:hypothetical protein